jgi:DNA-binding beta-propeller fold protein YncE
MTSSTTLATMMSTFVCVLTGASGLGNNQLSGPQGVMLDPRTGTLHIADSGNHRVMRYLLNAPSGTLLAGGNGPGTSMIQLSHPRGVYYCSSSNSLIIANANAHNIVRWVLGVSSWTLVAVVSSGLSGNSSALLNFLHDFSVDSVGNMYAADVDSQRIQLFLPRQFNDTTVAGVAGTSGNTPMRLNGPCALAFNNQLNIYVADI